MKEEDEKVAKRPRARAGQKAKERKAKVKRVRRKPVPVESRDNIFRDLLVKRKEILRRRPRFLRQESWRYKRIGSSWRKPKGIDSKMRLSSKGLPPLVKVGYRSPRFVRGLHPSGLRDILVYNVKELEKLNPKKDAIRLASTLGRRKRQELILRAKELGLRVLNPTLGKVVAQKAV